MHANTQPSTNVYNELRSKCALAGISLREACSIAGVNYQSVIEWKRDTPKSIKTLRAIEEAIHQHTK